MSQKSPMLFVLCLFTFLLTSITTVSAKWYNLGSAKPAPIKVEIIESSKLSTTIKYKVAGFNYNHLIINREKFIDIEIPDSSLTEKKGYPELPRVSRNILIPITPHTLSHSILEIKSRTLNIGVPSPSKGVISRSVNPDSVPYTINPFYKRGESFPKNSFELGSPFILRNTKGANVTFMPVQYNGATQEITVITELVVKIKTTPLSNRISTKLFNDKKRFDPDFINIFKQHYANYESIIENDAEIAPDKFISEKTRVLVISHEKFVEAIKPFIQWKIEKGFNVKLATLAETGVVYTSIKDYIQKDYDENNTSYVVLVGDAEFVSYHEGTAGNAKGNEADPMYSLTAGDDNYPDLFVSRLSVKTVEELENVVARSINYEKNPDLDGSWYSKGVGIASDEGTPKDKERAEWLREMMEKWHYKSVDKLYDPSVKAIQVTEAINEGRGFINYIGHGSETFWVTSGFSNSNIDALNNGSKLPFIVSVACVNGNFGYGSDVFAERWIKAGTTLEPKGAVAIYASSTNQSWVPPTIGQKEIVNLLTTEKLNTIGGLFFNGVIAVLEDNSDSADQTFQTWHIFGDATLQVRTREPEKIDAILPSGLVVGSNGFKLNVGAKGIRIGVVQDEILLGSGLSGENGELDVTFKEPILKPGTVLFTLTGFNRIPLIERVPVNVPISFVFTPLSRTIEESILGTTVSVTIKNSDGTPASGVNLWVEGVNYKSDISVTDQDGNGTIQFQYEYGPNVTIKGKREGEDFYILNESYYITGAQNPTGHIRLVNDVNLDGSFAVGFPGTLIFEESRRRGVKIYLTNKNQIVASNDGNSLTYTPTTKGTYEALVGQSGFNILRETFSAIDGFGDLTVKVVSSDGSILKDVKVTLNSRKLRTRGFANTTGDDGIVAFEKIPIGNYSIGVSKFGYLTKSESKFVKCNKNALMIVQNSAPKFTLKGAITLEEAPVSANLRVFKDQDSSAYATFDTGEDGLYSLELPAYTYKILVSAKGAKLNAQTVVISSDVDLLINLEKSSGVLILFRNGTYNGSAESAQIMKSTLEQLGITVVLEPLDKTDVGSWFGYTALMALNSRAGNKFEVGSQLLDFVEKGGKLFVEGGDVAYAHQSDPKFLNKVLMSKELLNESINQFLFPDNSPISILQPLNIKMGYSASDTVAPEAEINILATSKQYPNDATIVTNGSNVFISCDINQIKNEAGERDEFLMKLMKFWMGI